MEKKKKTNNKLQLGNTASKKFAFLRNVALQKYI